MSFTNGYVVTIYSQHTIGYNPYALDHRISLFPSNPQLENQLGIKERDTHPNINKICIEIANLPSLIKKNYGNIF